MCQVAGAPGGNLGWTSTCPHAKAVPVGGGEPRYCRQPMLAWSSASKAGHRRRALRRRRLRASIVLPLSFFCCLICLPLGQAEDVAEDVAEEVPFANPKRKLEAVQLGTQTRVRVGDLVSLRRASNRFHDRSCKCFHKFVPLDRVPVSPISRCAHCA